MLSIIIPSRQPEFLQKTIDDLILKAEGEIEIIVVLDGYWPETMPGPDSHVRIIHQGQQHNSWGMRAGINTGMAIARGDFIMKVDEHVMVSQGFDEGLKADCGDEDIIIPRRGRLDAENWQIIEDGRIPIDYMYVEYPYLKPLDKTQGLHGAEWKQRFYDRQDELISETPTMQGSCYFAKKSYWDKLFPHGLDDASYGQFTGEAQEISFSAWLSGGRVLCNKKVQYYHFHKGSRGKGYGFSNAQYRQHMDGTEKGRVYAIEHWTRTNEYKYDFAWFVNEKFPNMPNWPENWQERIITDRERDYSTLKYKPNWFENNQK